jgi:hypothetical protein
MYAKRRTKLSNRLNRRLGKNGSQTPFLLESSKLIPFCSNTYL